MSTELEGPAVDLVVVPVAPVVDSEGPALDFTVAPVPPPPAISPAPPAEEPPPPVDTMPVLTATGERLYGALTPLARRDAEFGYPLARFCSSVATMLDLAATLGEEGENGEPGFAVLFDPDRVPAILLPYVAQFIGVTIPPTLDEATARHRIRSTDGFKRGSNDAIAGAVRQYLAGTKTVYLTERNGSAYRLTVATLAEETPIASQVAAALAEQVPAGIIWQHVVLTGGTYADLAATHSDYADVLADFDTYADVLADPSAQ